MLIILLYGRLFYFGIGLLKLDTGFENYWVVLLLMTDTVSLHSLGAIIGSGIRTGSRGSYLTIGVLLVIGKG